MPEQIVITGWGQITQPKNATPPFLDPLDMMEQAARAARYIAGEKIWQALDSLLVVRTQSRDIARADLALAERLGLRVKQSAVSGIGGDVPQHYVNQAAGMLARGEAKAVLICGAETYYPRDDDAVRGDGALMQGISDDYDADDIIIWVLLLQRHARCLAMGAQHQ